MNRKGIKRSLFLKDGEICIPLHHFSYPCSCGSRGFRGQRQGGQAPVHPAAVGRAAMGWASSALSRPSIEFQNVCVLKFIKFLFLQNFISSFLNPWGKCAFPIYITFNKILEISSRLEERGTESCILRLRRHFVSRRKFA